MCTLCMRMLYASMGYLCLRLVYVYEFPPLMELIHSLAGKNVSCFWSSLFLVLTCCVAG